jgi:polar amino acid transport system substrate-binding protein
VLIIVPGPVSADDARSVLYAIREKKILKVGISRDYPPLNFKSGEKGLEIEMIRALGQFLEADIKLVPLNVADYAKSITGGEVDCVIAGLSRNLDRARKIWFSSPYLSTTPAAIVSDRALPKTEFGPEFEQIPIRTIWDLRNITGMVFAVKKGSVYERIINTEFLSSRMIIVETNEEGLEKLTRGEANAFVHDSLYLQYIFNTRLDLLGSYRLLHGGSKTEQICVGLPFGDHVFKNQIDVFISELQRTGLVESWLNRYKAEKLVKP